MMLERGAQSNEAKNVALEDEAVDMRVDSDRFCWYHVEKRSRKARGQNVTS
jgi:hypothetical protein